MAAVDARYSDLSLGQVGHVFQDLQALLGKALPWLFELRLSSMFLSLWRQEGQALLRVVQEEGGEQREQKEGEYVMLAGAGDAEEVSLTQQHVLKRLLPSVQRKWLSIYKTVKDGSISVPALSELFEGLEDEEDLAHEVQLLAQTGKGESGDSKEAAWVPESRRCECGAHEGSEEFGMG